MHFSIPDVSEISAKSSSNQQSYTLFNIYINGLHHCSLRYSQLYTFNEELKRLYPTAMANIETFPPKKLFSLSTKDTEERRISLEHYLQSVAQNRHIVTSSYFNEFFLNSQCETFSSDTIDNNEKINLTICFLNKHEVIIENLQPNDNTSRLLDACITKVQLQKDFLPHFGLYLYEQKDNQLNMLRPLCDFESPYLSLKQIKKNHEHACIVLKKSYWDSTTDLQLIEDRRALKLLFLQAQYEMEQSQQLYPSDIYRQLDVLRENKSFKEYILLARTSKFYGYIILQQCSILYPIDDTIKQKLCQCVLAVGNNEVICRIPSEKNKEINFKVTRIRCWKVNWTKKDSSISIEYLIKKDTLYWIVIHSEQAPLISICLQSMVDEILAKKGPPPTAAAATTTTTTAAQSASSKTIGSRLPVRTDANADGPTNTIFDAGGDDEL